MEQIKKQKQGDWIVFAADANQHDLVREMSSLNEGSYRQEDPFWRDPHDNQHQLAHEKDLTWLVEA